MSRSTSTPPARPLNASWIASQNATTRAEFLLGLTATELAALPYLFDFWAHDHQRPPEGRWRSWVILGGRGAGKTRAGAEWVRAEVEGPRPDAPGRARRVALVGETYDQVRDVMIFGDSGILACAPPDCRPVWEATKRRLVWPNGAEAQAFSASEPEALRGPQFDAAWADEMGCAAIDKGTNQPNKFLDTKSSESALPYASTGHRDDFIQVQYLRALREVWSDPAQNPTDATTGVTMIDMSRAHVWAWDARPYPWFPNRRALWSDWENYERGHWLNGRAGNRTLASVVEEICARSGLTGIDTSGLYGTLRGYAVSDVSDARAALQPLMSAYGIEAAERDGGLAFFSRRGRVDVSLDTGELAVSGDLAGDLEQLRDPEAEMLGRVRLSSIEAGGAYAPRATEAILPDEETHGVAGADLPLVLTGAEAQEITERWLIEARVSRDRVRFALPPSVASARAGDVVEIGAGAGASRFRIDHVEEAGARIVQAVRVEPGVYAPADTASGEVSLDAFTLPVPVEAIWLDLPVLSDTGAAQRPHLAIAADPWPGPVAVHSSATDNGYALNTLIEAPATLGLTENALPRARPGVIDRGPVLRVRMLRGVLSSVGEDGMLAGANLAAIGGPGPDGWEVFQFAVAELVEEGVYALSDRLRGQGGSEPFIADDWPAGTMVVFLNAAVTPVDMALSLRGLSRHFRIGPASEPIDDESYTHHVVTTEGVGLRPYRPVHLGAERIDGDLDVRWIRRTRVDGDSWQGAEVPLGEEREQYVVKVIHGGAVVRETVTEAPGWTYLAAMQAADGVSAPFKIEVAQVSQSFGPGPGARIEVLV